LHLQKQVREQSTLSYRIPIKLHPNFDKPLTQQQEHKPNNITFTQQQKPSRTFFKYPVFVNASPLCVTLRQSFNRQTVGILGNNILIIF
jgi:hypothetical protein